MKNSEKERKKRDRFAIPPTPLPLTCIPAHQVLVFVTLVPCLVGVEPDGVVVVHVAPLWSMGPVSGITEVDRWIPIVRGKPPAIFLVYDLLESRSALLGGADDLIVCAVCPAHHNRGQVERGGSSVGRIGILGRAERLGREVGIWSRWAKYGGAGYRGCFKTRVSLKY